MERPNALILDTETTGLDGEVVELAVIDSAGTVLLDWRSPIARSPRSRRRR